MKSVSLEGQSFRGVVSRGNQVGRTIGFPTANIAIEPCPSESFGVYVCLLKLDDGAIHEGVANVGIKPTIGHDVPLLEAHIFDFSSDIYGSEICVKLVKHLRAERRFGSVRELGSQLSLDCEDAKKVHALRSRS